MPDQRMSGSARPAIVVRADTRDVSAHSGTLESQDARRPDFALLRSSLDGRIIDLNDVEASAVGRIVQRIAGTYVALAVVSFRRREEISAYVTGSENEAIILALLFKVTRTYRPIVAVGVYPAKPQKWGFWRRLRVHSHLHRVMPLGSAQADRLINGLGVPSEKVAVLPYGVDTEFWLREKAHPRASNRPYFFAAGLQHRDYSTLIAAADGLDVDLVIAAASLWSKSANELDDVALPPWVTVESMDYVRLRDAYAGALAAVAPVVETDFAPGMTSILEAMSMGLPVVVTRAEGNGDYITDRRRVLRSGPHRATSAAFSATAAPTEAQGQTGFYVSPGDVEGMRSILKWIIEHPADAQEIGARGKQVAGAVHSLEAYVGRIQSAVEQGITADRERRRQGRASWR